MKISHMCTIFQLYLYHMNTLYINTVNLGGRRTLGTVVGAKGVIDIGKMTEFPFKYVAADVPFLYCLTKYELYKNVCT